MVAVGDILELVLRSHWNDSGDENLNVFHYEVTEQTGLSELWQIGQGIIDSWAGELTSYFQDVTSSQIVFDGMDIRNLTDTSEIFTGNFTDPFAGGVTGDVLPPFASWGFLYRRATTVTRNGYKRFPGVPESLQANGVATSAAIEDLTALAAILNSPLEASGVTPGVYDITMLTRIVRKDENGALVLFQPVTAVDYRGIGTQNTRKLGRGM